MPDQGAGAKGGDVGNGGQTGQSGQGQGGEGSGDGGDGAVDVKLIDARVNAAISTQLSRFRQSFEKDVAGTISKSLEPLASRMEALTTIGAGGDDKKDKGKGDEAAEIQKKADARIAELERKYADSESKRESETKARARDEERAALSQALRTAGIGDNRLRAAVALLYNEDARVGRNDGGEIIFKIPKAGYTDEVTLEDGITGWLTTEEGKTFLPARGAGGSGGTGSPHQKRRSGPSTKEERVADARRTLREASGIPVGE
jgi:hypothetical protein